MGPANDDGTTITATSADDTTSAGPDSADDEGSTGGPPITPCPGGDSDYALEIISPLPVGPAPEGFDANHRVYRAYPGLPYEIRVAAIGGNYPFTYALDHAPAGMTIDEQTGDIRWPDPQADADDIAVTVTDSSGNTDTQTWSIAVGTEGFHFVDATRGQDAPQGTGTLDAPWRTLADVYAQGQPSGIVYFRSGTYTLEGIAAEGVDTDEERVDFEEGERPVIWIGYPDDPSRPVIDYGYTGEGEGAVVPRIRVGGHNVYFDDLEFARSYRMALQVGRDGQHGSSFRRLTMHDTGPGLDGGNSAFIMYITCEGCESNGDIVQDIEFFDINNGTGNCALKLYAMNKTLIADNVFHDTGLSQEVVAIKAGIHQFDVRGNTFQGIAGRALGGNMHYAATSGEFRFNNVDAPQGEGGALRLNQDYETGPVHVYRNTFVGRVQIDGADEADGPFAFEHNVIINEDAGARPLPFFWFVEVFDPTRVTSTDDIVGTAAEGIVDDQGQLQGSYARFIGTHGHALGDCGR